MQKRILLKLGTLVLSLITFACSLSSYVFATKTEETCVVKRQRKRRRYITNVEDQEALAVVFGNYMVKYGATYKEIAEKFNISKTTVRDYIKKLETIDNPLYKNVRKVVGQNKKVGAGRTDSEQCVLAYCLGNYIVKSETNYVKTAAAFGISKTTVGNYIKKLKKIDELLYKEVRQVVEWHKHCGKCFK